MSIVEHFFECQNFESCLLTQISVGKHLGRNPKKTTPELTQYRSWFTGHNFSRVSSIFQIWTSNSNAFPWPLFGSLSMKYPSRIHQTGLDACIGALLIQFLWIYASIFDPDTKSDLSSDNCSQICSVCAGLTAFSQRWSVSRQIALVVNLPLS